MADIQHILEDYLDYAGLDSNKARMLKNEMSKLQGNQQLKPHETKSGKPMGDTEITQLLERLCQTLPILDGEVPVETLLSNLETAYDIGKLNLDPNEPDELTKLKSKKPIKKWLDQVVKDANTPNTEVAEKGKSPDLIDDEISDFAAKFAEGFGSMFSGDVDTLSSDNTIPTNEQPTNTDGQSSDNTQSTDQDTPSTDQANETDKTIKAAKDKIKNKLANAQKIINGSTTRKGTKIRSLDDIVSSISNPEQKADAERLTVEAKNALNDIQTAVNDIESSNDKNFINLINGSVDLHVASIKEYAQKVRELGRKSAQPPTNGESLNNTTPPTVTGATDTTGSTGATGATEPTTSPTVTGTTSSTGTTSTTGPTTSPTVTGTTSSTGTTSATGPTTSPTVTGTTSSTGATSTTGPTTSPTVTGTTSSTGATGATKPTSSSTTPVDVRTKYKAVYDLVDAYAMSTAQADLAKRFVDTVLNNPTLSKPAYNALTGRPGPIQNKCIFGLLNQADPKLGYKDPSNPQGTSTIPFDKGTVTQSRSTSSVKSALVMPDGFGQKKNPAIWNTPVITDFGFPFLNFSSEAMVNIIKSKEDDENIKNANLKAMFKDAAKKLGGIWKAIYASPLALLRQIASELGTKCTPNYIKVDSSDLIDTDSGETVNIFPIKYYSIEPEYEPAVSVPRDFLTSFYEVMDYTTTSKKTYLKYAFGMSAEDFAEEIDDNGGVPPFYILIPKAGKFSKCNINPGSLFGSLLNLILGRKKCTMVKTMFMGKRGCLAMESDVANKLYADT